MRLNLKAAAKALLHEQVVAIPTETVYGLAGVLQSEQAIDRIFSLKNRPAANPLIIHVSSAQEIEPFVQTFPKDFEILAKTFWPGPLTIVLPVKEETILGKARAGLCTAAFRIPALPLTRKLLQMTGPLVAPSANLSGTPSATSPEHVEKDFGELFPVLDGGPTQCGLESTILVFSEETWKLARLGSITVESLETCLGYEIKFVNGRSEKPLCPGQLYRHYAPRAHLHMDEDFSKASLILGFSDRNYSVRSISMGASDDVEGVATQLYHVLRKLDLDGEKEAWVDLKFPETGLWRTIRERLFRAGGY